MELSNADLYQAYVVQGSRKMPVDFHALLVDGDLSQNITLSSGDTIVIPPASTEMFSSLVPSGNLGLFPSNPGSYPFCKL